MRAKATWFGTTFAASLYIINKVSVSSIFVRVYRIEVQTPIATNSRFSEVKHNFGVKADEGQEGLAAALPSVAQSELLPNA